VLTVSNQDSFESDIDVHEFSKLISNSEVIVLDVRTPEEVSEGFIATARNIDFYSADFENDVTSLDKEVTYAIYCRSGKRSGHAVKIMQSAGFQKLYNLEGGIIEWENSGLPVVNK